MTTRPTTSPGWDPVLPPAGGGAPPPPRRGPARKEASRSRRLAPAVLALVAMVALAGVTVPLALRAADRGAYLTSTSDGQDATGGGAADAPPGKDRTAGGETGTTGGGGLSSS